MAGEFPVQARQWVDQIRRVALHLDARTRAFEPTRSPSDLRDIAALAMSVRAISFALSFADQVEEGRQAPAATLARSLFEGAVTLRWALQSAANSARWFDAGRLDARAIVQTHNHGGLPDLANHPRGAEIEAFMSERPPTASVPSIQKRAKTVGMSAHYAGFYRVLSAQAHGSLLGQLLDDSGTLLGHSREYRMILGVLVPGVNMTNDVDRVFHHWAEHRTVAPVEPIR